MTKDTFCLVMAGICLVAAVFSTHWWVTLALCAAAWVYWRMAGE